MGCMHAMRCMCHQHALCARAARQHVGHMLPQPQRLQVAEGYDVLAAINDTFVDKDGRPFQNIR